MFDVNKEIKTVDDVKSFFSHLIDIENVNFHPDDDFSEYVDDENNAYYSEEDSELRNERMSECFSVCDDENEDIYELAYSAIIKTYIPD